MKIKILLFSVFIMTQFWGAQLHAQWIHTGVPLAYPVASVQFVAGNLVASTSDGSVYLSTNDGASWNHIDSLLPTTWGSFHLASNNTEVFAGNSYGIFVTTDFGGRWDEVDSTLRGPNGTEVLCLASYGSRLFAGLNDGLYVSINNGESWTATGLLGEGINAVAQTDSTILAASARKVFYSTDGGKSWGAAGNMSISTFAVNGENVFAGGANGLYRSTDAGITWTEIDSGLTTKGVAALCISDRNVVVGTSGGVFLSTDNGNSWVADNKGLVSTNIVSLDTEGTDLLAGTQAGLYISTDNGSNWKPVGLTVSAMSDAWVSGLATVGNKVIAAADFPSELYFSTDGGGAWEYKPVLDCSGRFGKIGNHLLLANSAGIYSSKDSGSSWAYLGDTLSATNQNEVNAFFTDNIGVYAATNNGVYVSTDTGKTWVAAGLSSSAVTAITAAWGLLFAGEGFYVYKSENNGATWASVGTGIGSITSLSVAGDELVAGSDLGGIAVSSDSGKTWVSSGGSNGITNTIIGGIVADAGNIFAATNGGVFLSTDGGNTWNNESNGLPDIPLIKSIVVSSRYLFVGLQQGGVWRRPLSEMVTIVVANDNMVPRSSFLFQNFPNPFNPSTLIRYELAKNSRVKVGIYDVLGRIVATLVDGYEIAGVHAVDFDGSRLASGTYFYRLTVGGRVITKKMLLLK